MKLYTLPNDNNFDLHCQRLNRDSNFVQFKCKQQQNNTKPYFFHFSPFAFM